MAATSAHRLRRAESRLRSLQKTLARVRQESEINQQQARAVYDYLKHHEIERRHAQKLESLGQMSAGIAHEINTPMQFIGDNLHFVREGLAAGPAAASPEHAPLIEALDAAADGVRRVSEIVEAMRAFSHPHTAWCAVDVNKNLRDTLVVARNAWKTVAEIRTDLGELPPVTACGSDLNQVFLNLIINAAQAIADRTLDRGALGHIGIRTRHDGDDVHVWIEDDGGGIPEAVRHRVFDPFFTTKPVGQGTGQGLAIARTIVVDRHGGSLDFDCSATGTTFHVRLPVAGPPAAREPA